MDTLLTYLNSLTPDKRDEFAAKCETTVGYLRKAISIRQRLGEKLCIAIERESGGAVRCEDLRTDVDWAYLRGTANNTAGGEASPSSPRPLTESCQGGANSALPICEAASTGDPARTVAAVAAGEMKTDGEREAA